MTARTIGAPGLAPSLAPGLYVTATPIGNLKDITYRAVQTLQQVDLILCEDSRISSRLCRAYDIRPQLKAYHDHNGDAMRPEVLRLLGEGKAIALISDAGTPLISDPGYKLVRAVRDAGFEIFTVPGPSALTAALSIAGAPTDKFLFGGFLPAKQQARVTELERHRHQTATLVFYDTGPRLAASLAAIAEIWPGRQVAVARELSKMHEEVKEGSAETLAATYHENGPPKGEIVIVLHPVSKPEWTHDAARALLYDLLAHLSVKDAATEAAKQTGLPRKDLYTMALSLRGTA
ncbi:MAG: 16S rRNA (cytidine(1402)-2'-O)-methyltransferase [Parvularculaceae bacterium]